MSTFKNGWLFLALFASMSCIEQEYDCAEDEEVVDGYEPDTYYCRPKAVCVSGETQQCWCASGATGAQACNNSGTGYGSCQCVTIARPTPEPEPEPLSEEEPISEPEPIYEPEPVFAVEPEMLMEPDDLPDLPPPIILNVPLYQQQTPVWCWLAVSEMAIAYRNYGMSLEQCEMLAIGYYGYYDPFCCYYPEYCLITSSGWEPIVNILYYVGGSVSQWSPPTDYMELYDYLSNDLPVIAQIQSGITSTHVVIIRGMEFDVDTNGQVVPILYINDPLAWVPQTTDVYTFSYYWIDSLIVY